MRAFVVAISGLLLAFPALAQTSGLSGGSSTGLAEQSDLPESSGPGASAGTDSPDGERRICRPVEAPTSSRIATRRVCKTAEEWRAAQRAR